MKNPGIGSPYCKGCGSLITATGGVDSLVCCCSHQTYNDGTYNGGYCMSCCPHHGCNGCNSCEEDTMDSLEQARETVKEAKKKSHWEERQSHATVAAAEALIDIARSLRDIRKNGLKTYPEGP